MAFLRPPILRPCRLTTSAFASTSRLTLHSPSPNPSPIPSPNPSTTSTSATFSTTPLASVGQRLPATFVDLKKAEKYRNYVRRLKCAKYVLVSNLPTTATPTDLRSLAFGQKTFNDVSRIEYIYTRSLSPSSKAIVSFSSPIHSHDYESHVHGRILGGKQLSASLYTPDDRVRLLQRTYASWPQEYQLPLDLIEYEGGKLVLLNNIPQETTEARLEERLAVRYDLKPQDRWRGKRESYAGWEIDKKGYGGSHDAVLGGVFKLPKWHPDATTTAFLVRCQTAVEAMRLVRRWHNTFFAPATFDIQVTGGRFKLSASVLY
ncbi:hypothetical protein NDA14_001928 [Ustilago hordei]|uniref:RRM domain-containing protein n=1 Tax=Ustilago hordei TaxID=120017 RepID=I2FT63_USTHO|nr:uncharacterized protein UHO2_06012 [Ustilago hordei]KAJ1572627.1 hypothetical protein NDA12_007713 [Ustilago hordei]KAJ1576244.1 hypothetical protein NDA15_006564 [Ustilago hordei]KAJ1595335.1 hypothetical protein NDA14_001928 [Ustilago hordei]CCF50106.1 uncharacterized protein UHOR_07088 [Ustilago hordei]SYW83391.1 uncharacterized protein UHO2_06012 [Ustilago hordei]